MSVTTSVTMSATTTDGHEMVSTPGAIDVDYEHEGTVLSIGKMLKVGYCGDRLSIVKNFMSKDMCADLINRANQKGWSRSSVSGGGHGRTSNDVGAKNFFAVIEDPKLTDDYVWNIARKFVPTTPENLTQNPYFNSVTKGSEWILDGIYPVIRIYKYENDDSFPEHDDYKVRKRCVAKDGTTTEYMSFLTLLVYLDHDFVDGRTVYWPVREDVHCRFLRDSDKETGKKKPSISIKPLTGTAVIQDQIMMHEGLAPVKGTKHIVRFDVIYKRVIPPNPKLKYDGKVVDGDWQKVFEPSCKNYAL